MTNTDNNKRIAKNTAFLYFRMLLLMCISLYTSRVVLAVLGVSDYGIFNVVGGFVAMFSVVSGSLSSTISRFITYELGRGDSRKLKSVFSTSFIIQIVMAVIICVLVESFGVWFLNNKMTIPPERVAAANWVLHISAMSFMVDLVRVPYNALIIAHERMSVFAYISIFEAVARLVIVFGITAIGFDKLVVYAFLILLLALLMCGIYAFYCRRHFAEARISMEFDIPLLKEMFALIGWTFWGNGAAVIKDQGSNVILNIFCGPVVNAARGVAVQVNTAVTGFITNFLIAVNPQITKSYSVGNVDYMYSLIINSTRYAFFILTILFVTLCANIDYVLSLWLTEVPSHTSNFVIFILLFSLLDTFCLPLLTGAMAEGHVKGYEIALTICYIANTVASYFAMRFGYEPEMVFVLNIIFKVFVMISLIWHCRIRFSFPVGRFLFRCVFPCLLVLAVSSFIAYFVKFDLGSDFLDFILSSFAIIFITAVIVFLFGVTAEERRMGVAFVRMKLKKNNSKI